MIEIAADPFDTGLFGRPVHKAWIGGPLDAHDEARLQALCATPGLVCAFARCDYATSSRLQALGFQVISVRATYERPLGPAAPAHADGLTLRRLSAGVPDVAEADLATLADVLGETSRYYKDEALDRGAARRLYVTWIENSLFRGYAREAVLAYQGDHLVGLHTLRVRDGVGTIDLIGLRPEYQGRGAGQALLDEGLAACAGLEVTRVRVVTEAENVRASRFYQRNGFLLTSTELVWHRDATA